MNGIFPPYDLTIEPLIVIRLRSPPIRNPATHPFELVHISHCQGPECLDGDLTPIQLAFPNIRESARGVGNSVAYSDFGEMV
jgi:hypothetical protein